MKEQYLAQIKISGKGFIKDWYNSSYMEGGPMYLSSKESATAAIQKSLKRFDGIAKTEKENIGGFLISSKIDKDIIVTEYRIRKRLISEWEDVE